MFSISVLNLYGMTWKCEETGFGYDSTHNITVPCAFMDLKRTKCVFCSFTLIPLFLESIRFAKKKIELPFINSVHKSIVVKLKPLVLIKCCRIEMMLKRQLIWLNYSDKILLITRSSSVMIRQYFPIYLIISTPFGI